jgi:hypothetical protein
MTREEYEQIRLTRPEIMAAHEGETCGDCGEGIAKAQIKKVVDYALAQGWGRMITKEETQMFVPLSREDLEIKEEK